MRILQVTNKVPYPANDGGAIACLNLTRGFSLLNNQVTVLAMNTLKHHVELHEIPEKITDLADFRLVEVPAGVSKISALYNLFFSKKPYNAVRFISENFNKELEKLLIEKQFDIIQLEGLYVCTYIPLIRRYSKARIVYRAHNIEFEIWARASEMTGGWMKLYLKNLSKRIKKIETGFLNKYDLLVPITERDGAILDELGNEKPTHVSQTGIDTSVMIPNAKKLEHPSLFHIGSLDWLPNQEGLLWFFKNCWDEIHLKFPELKFYVAGRNAPRWLVKKLELPNVEFLGEIEDAYDFMNSKSIMVVPLFSGSGMRVKIIEGMALGKAIISTTVGAEGIITKSGEDLLIADNRSEFVSAIEKLITDEEFFRNIGKSAIEFIHKKFDNLVTSAKLIEFYKQHI